MKKIKRVSSRYDDMTIEELNEYSSIEYLDFLGKIEDVPTYGNRDLSYGEHGLEQGIDWEYKDKKSKEIDRYKDTLYTRWTSGGQCGGSCWDDDGSNLRDIDGDSEPPYSYTTDTIKSMLKVAVNINDDEFEKMLPDIEKMIHENDDTNYEYYGNYTSYGYHKIRIFDLWKYLIMNTWI